MRMTSKPENGVQLALDIDEAQLLDRLVTQLIELLHSNSSTALDPDPLFAELEVGGSETTPEDPALARLFPDAFADTEQASEFRKVTEQGILNRKLRDAMQVSESLGLGPEPLLLPENDAPVQVTLSAATIQPWLRTLTALRLAIASRIGLQTPADHAKLTAAADTSNTVAVFDWLGAILESLLSCLEQ